MEKLPEKVEGIPTGKHEVNARFKLLISYYEKLWKDLQRDSHSNSIRNKFLNAEVFIVKNESDKKTVREAMHNWKSTYAVKHLRKIVENAHPMERLPLFSSVKGGTQKKNGYKHDSTLLFF